ncbi:S8 family serine peptidase [Frigidibacter sp. MR17.14]|uniref:S8 family serine peptidase n=1 Tax=Frigidibacter sp. MR17.14 TaxID=3126509 RepID=UPI00301317F9
MAELQLTPSGTRGEGRYPAFHALWHLCTIGVVQDVTTFASSAWDLAERRLDRPGSRPTLVAMIDTSVAGGHPNLKDAVAQDLALDLFSAELGAFPTPAATLPPELSGPPPTPATAKALPFADRLFAGLAARYAADRPGAPDPSRVFPATRASFSAHGTAMAGLIGARPLGADAVQVVGPVLLPVPGTPPGTGPGAVPVTPQGASGFAYAGVDPYCRIVPISTNFEPEAEQLIFALLYAWRIGADLIVLAREVSSPLATVAPVTGEDPDLATRLMARLGVGFRPDELDAWTVFEALLLEISRKIPVVCAAGNSAEDHLAYPASLARPDNGIIAVGAHSSTGQPAAFTCGHKDVSVYAPSGDGERLDLAMTRVDTDSAGYQSTDQSVDYLAGLGAVPLPGGGAATAATYSSLDIVSTDVPGRAGYNSSVFTGLATSTGAILDYRSYYCRFSGTSAATAITAGLLSLAYSSGALKPGDGPAAKKALRGAGATNPAAATPKLDWSRLPRPPAHPPTSRQEVDA